jgi:lipoate-protein ligase A
MKYLDLTFSDPAADLACDEALLRLWENAEEEGVLRIWEPETYFVVLGYSNKVASEVYVDTCAVEGIPIFRRCSGGGAVLQGPGCLNYALVWKAREGADNLTDLGESYRFVLERHRGLFERLTQEAVEIQGTSDLAINGRKFSGNSQHRKRRAILLHGSFLLHLDTALVEKCLRLPARQPAYRTGRPHRDFVKNLFIDPERTRQHLRGEWAARDWLADPPFGMIEALVRERYSRAEWNFRF